MSEPPGPGAAAPAPRGAVAWMARNSVAANLVMVFLLVGGLGMAFFIKKEVLPDATLDVVEITVAYPGSSPAEIEKGILLPVEEAVRGLEVVKEVTATARESTGRIRVELTTDASRDRGLQRIDQAVDAIRTFPDEAEEPEVRLAARRREVLEVRLFGDASPWALRQIAERVRDRLVRQEGITQVELEFEPGLVTHVEIPQERLRSLGLTLEAVAARIREASEDVPAGRLETSGGRLMLRLKERKQWAREFAAIPVVNAPQGSAVLLGDIATLRDGFEETRYYSRFSGEPSLEIAVYRVGAQTPIEVSDTVERTMASLASDLPPALDYRITDNRAEDYRLRLSLLLKNGAIGLVLVLTVLGVFLQARLAAWVTLGMFTSFIGSLLMLPAFGVSINMVSMFAFLVALGIVVDDAIVFGENVYECRERGLGRLEAAIQGVHEMAVPVTFGVLTSCVAFAPLLFIPGQMGLIWSTIPVVVIAVFLISLVEALFVLPAHLAHTERPSQRAAARWLHERQQRFSEGFRERVQARLRPALDVCVEHRYVTIAVALALLAAVVGYALSDRMGLILMPRVPSQEFAASAQMPSDATDAQAREVAERLTDAALAVIRENGGERLAEGINTDLFGSTVSVDVVLVRGDDRPLSVEDFERLWRERTGPVPEAESLSFEMEGGFGSWRPDITVDLSHPRIQTLNRASQVLEERLAAYEVTSDVNDSYQRGSARLDFELNARGEALGLTPALVGRQLRDAFQGAEAMRFLRGPSEVRVRVKLPDAEQDSVYHAERLMIRMPEGGEVPLADVARVTTGSTFQTIERRQGRRVVTVQSDVTPSSEMSRMLSTLRQELLPELASEFPGLTWSFQGRQVQMRESLSALFAGLLLALLAIYAMLAIPFRSYVQPLIVMVAIPFGAFGAIVGHMLLGYELSLLSLMGIVGLSGVVVNDSLIMVEYANRLRERFPPLEAIKRAGVRRFRPILLTTLTTFGGLSPIILEQSRQARFLIPMAISLGFGILFATAIILIIVPCFYMVVEDAKALARELRARI